MKRLIRNLCIPLLFISLVILICSCRKKPTLPVVTTDQVSGINQTSAISGGHIKDDGGSSIVTRGICWSITPEPNTSDNSVLVTVGDSDSFTANMTLLIPGTMYYVKAFAVNSEGIGYGNQVSFTTSPVVLASLTTNPVQLVTSSSAEAGGTINTDGGGQISDCGVCWSTSAGPTVAGLHSSYGTASGNFIVILTGLSEASTYYLRAYATNSAGTAYGEELTFRTLVSDIDGNLYKTIVIGTQVWMAENLRTTKYNNNADIPLVTGNQEWASLTTPAYSWYNNDESANKSTYGALYNWYAINTGNLCPTGWHVPLSTEWTILINYLGGEASAGGKLKEAGLSHWATPNTGATNQSGFTALPAGVRHNVYVPVYSYGIFDELNLSTWFTAIDEASPVFAYWLNLTNITGDAILRNSAPKNVGFSVRCLRD